VKKADSEDWLRHASCSTRFRAAVVLLFLGLLVLPHRAAGEPGGQTWKFLRLDVGTWITTGEGEWTIEFEGPLSTSEGDPFVRGRSILKLERLTNTLITGRVELALTRRFSLDAAIGLGTSLSGRATDTDLGFLPTRDLIRAIASKAEAGGETAVLTTNAYLRVVPFTGESENFVDLFAGYIFYRDALDLTSGVEVFRVGAPSPLGRIVGLDSSYDFAWRGVRVGARGELAAHRRLRAGGQVALIPWTTYDGKGFWNLRPLHFTHEAEGGLGVDALTWLRLALLKHMHLELGFRYLTLHVEDGQDIKLFPDGEVIVSDLQEVESSRYGPYIMINVGF